LVTGLLVGLAFSIKRHYMIPEQALRRLNELVPVAEEATPQFAAHQPGPLARSLDPRAPTAALLVNGFNGLGLHTLLAVNRMFPGFFKNFVFVQIGVVDVASFKGAAELNNLEEHARREVDRYVVYMRQHGFYAEGYSAIGTDVVE